MKLVPPNFGYVEDGIFRCGLPEPRHYGFLSSLRLHTCILLTDTPHHIFRHWLVENGVRVLCPLAGPAYPSGGFTTTTTTALLRRLGPAAPPPSGGGQQTGASTPQHGTLTTNANASPGPPGTGVDAYGAATPAVGGGGSGSPARITCAVGGLAGGSSHTPGAVSAAAAAGGPSFRGGPSSTSNSNSNGIGAAGGGFGSAASVADGGGLTSSNSTVAGGLPGPVTPPSAPRGAALSSMLPPPDDLAGAPLSTTATSTWARLPSSLIDDPWGGCGGGGLPPIAGIDGASAFLWLDGGGGGGGGGGGAPHGLMTLSEPVVVRLLEILLDSSHYPLLITCPKGRYRTGIVCGCLRKIQRWNLVSILEEYRRYAGDKSRAENEEFIELFDTDLVNTRGSGGRTPTILYRG
eukprot:gene3782-2673_t